MERKLENSLKNSVACEAYRMGLCWDGSGNFFCDFFVSKNVHWLLVTGQYYNPSLMFSQ